MDKLKMLTFFLKNKLEREDGLNLIESGFHEAY